MNLSKEEVEAALYAADPVRWPPDMGDEYFRSDFDDDVSKKDRLEYG